MMYKIKVSRQNSISEKKRVSNVSKIFSLIELSSKENLYDESIEKVKKVERKKTEIKKNEETERCISDSSLTLQKCAWQCDGA